MQDLLLILTFHGFHHILFFEQEIFEISHDGRRFVAEKVIRHDTGLNPVMNCAAYGNDHHMYLVAGQENHSQLYMIKTSIIDDEVENVENHVQNNVRQRKNANGVVNDKLNSNNRIKRITFQFKPSDSIQTDFGRLVFDFLSHCY